MVESPCRDVCAVDGDICMGCGRTIQEIASWQSLTEADRTQIIEEIQQGERTYPTPE